MPMQGNNCCTAAVRQLKRKRTLAKVQSVLASIPPSIMHQIVGITTNKSFHAGATCSPFCIAHHKTQTSIASRGSGKCVFNPSFIRPQCDGALASAPQMHTVGGLTTSILYVCTYTCHSLDNDAELWRYCGHASSAPSSAANRSGSHHLSCSVRVDA